MKNVIEMARDAGAYLDEDECSSLLLPERLFERFAELIREECAKTCEELGAEGYGTLYIAAAIRGSK